MSKTQNEIIQICDSVRDLLLEKNRKYGDSALEPVRVMSRSTPVEQILVRIDDKLSRISRGAGLVGDDEDVITDLIGYFVLLKIALGRQSGEEVRVSDHVPFSVTYDDILKASRQDLDDRGEDLVVEYGVQDVDDQPLAHWVSTEETAYLDSVPGMRESILEGMATPSEDLSSEQALDWDSDDAKNDHSPFYYDRNRNRPYTEWYPEDVECGWDPNSGPTC